MKKTNNTKKNTIKKTSSNVKTLSDLTANKVFQKLWLYMCRFVMGIVGYLIILSISMNIVPPIFVMNATAIRLTNETSLNTRIAFWIAPSMFLISFIFLITWIALKKLALWFEAKGHMFDGRVMNDCVKSESDDEDNKDVKKDKNVDVKSKSLGKKKNK